MNEQYFDYLDGWRGLAIICLLIGHFYPIPGINFGQLGVNLFFVLSGLLMARLLFLKKLAIPVFYRRRISRIFPALYLFLCAIVLFFLVTGKTINWSEVGMAALLVNNYFPGELGNAVMPFGHIWSLSVEEHAYILLSLIALWSRRRSFNPIHAIAFFASAFALAGIYYWTQFSGRELEFAMWNRSEVSAYGIFISAFFLLLLNGRKIPQLPAILFGALMFFGFALHWWSVPSPARTILGVGVFALTVNLLTYASASVKAILAFAPFRKFGLWSFSIYIWQQPFYYAHYNGGMPGWLALILACSAGICSFYFIEKPVRRYLNANWARDPDKSDAVVIANAPGKSGTS